MYNILRLLLIPITITYILSLFILIPLQGISSIYSNEIPLHFYISFALGLLGLTIAVENFYRKEGYKVQSSIQITLTFGSKIEPTITKITLINLKDKPLIIYGIYVEIDPITIIEYHTYKEQEPLIIKPYESCTVLNHPAYFYQDSPNLISLKKRGIDIEKAKVILNTVVGKVITVPVKKNWKPTWYQFKLQPKTLSLDNVFISPEVEYIIQFDDHKDKYHVVFIDQECIQYGFDLMGITLKSKGFENKETLKAKLDFEILNHERIIKYNIIEPKKEILKNAVMESYEKHGLSPIVLKPISDLSACKFKLKIWLSIKRTIRSLKKQMKM